MKIISTKPILPDLSLLLLRVGIGGLMLTQHGWGKFQNFAGAKDFADPIGVGPELSYWLTVFAEAGCSLLLIIGLITRLATVPLIITMLVAAFIVHGDDPFARKEMAFLYLVPVLVIMLQGPGKYSLDHVIKR